MRKEGENEGFKPPAEERHRNTFSEEEDPERDGVCGNPPVFSVEGNRITDDVTNEKGKADRSKCVDWCVGCRELRTNRCPENRTSEEVKAELERLRKRDGWE